MTHDSYADFEIADKVAVVTGASGFIGTELTRQLVARGHTYKVIGAELFIAEKTVENHVRNILGKLHLSRKNELIRYAVEHGIE